MTGTTAVVLAGIVLLLIAMGVSGLLLMRRPDDPLAPAPGSDKPSHAPADPLWPKTTLATIDAAVAAEEARDPPDVRGITFYNPSKNTHDF